MTKRRFVLADHDFPVRPNLEQLKHQAKDLLRAIKQGEPSALAELKKHHRKAITPQKAKLANAQLALARSYGLPSWPRMATACRMTDAIWRGDVDTVRELAATRRSSFAWCHSPTDAADSAMASLLVCCWTMALVRMLARHCGSGCVLPMTTECTSIVT